MPSSRVLISSTTLTSTQTSVVFSSIPNTYSDLILKVSEVLNASGAADDLRLQLNGAWPSSTDTTTVNGTNITVSSSRFSYPTLPVFGKSNSTTINTFGNYEIYIPNYTSTTNKQIFCSSVSEANSTTNWYIYATAYFNATTSAITSLTFQDGGSAMKIGSSFYLYGLKNS